MKIPLSAWVVILALAMGNGRAQESRVQAALKTNTVVTWVGLDYSGMRLIGNTNNMRVPDLLLQDMPANWNKLFLDERLEGVARSLKSRVNIDIQAVTKANLKLSREQIVFGNDNREAVGQSHLKREDIAEMVRSYSLDFDTGVGLALIVDRFVYNYTPAQSDRMGRGIPAINRYDGAAYVVFFDLKTREILSCKREVRGVSTGGSFRNFWFGPIKDIDEGLGAYRSH
jgi:hypothetical protein